MIELVQVSNTVIEPDDAQAINRVSFFFKDGENIIVHDLIVPKGLSQEDFSKAIMEFDKQMQPQTDDDAELPIT